MSRSPIRTPKCVPWASCAMSVAWMSAVAARPTRTTGRRASPTTGTASAQMIDPDNNDAAADLTTGRLIGSPVDCNLGAQGDLSGSTTVSPFAALHALLGLDLTSLASLSCE